MKWWKVVIVLMLVFLIAGCAKEKIVMKIDKDKRISIFDKDDESGVIFPEDTEVTGDLFETEVAKPSEMVDN